MVSGSEGSVQTQTLGRLLMGAPPSPEMDWEAMVALARRYRLLPLLSFRLAEEHAQVTEDCAPAGVKEMLRREYLAAVAQAMSVDRQLARILAALEGASVPVIVVKGPALAAFYPHPALRSFGDLDLLVSPEYLELAAEALVGLGYRDTVSTAWEPKSHHHRPPMVSGDSRFVVELHHRLDDPVRVGRLPNGDLWARAMPWSVQGQPALQLEAVDTALYVCRHAVVQDLLRGGLRPQCDLAYVTRHWDPDDWHALVGRARDLGLDRAVFILLLLMEHALGQRVPAEVAEALRPAEGELLPGDLAQRFLEPEDHPATNMPPRAVRVWGMGTVRARVAYLLRYLSPSRQVMAARYNVPLDSPRIWWSYLWQPVDLLRRYGRAAWHLIRRDRASRAAWNREIWLQRWLEGEVGGG